MADYKYLVDVNLQQNELQEAVIQNLGTAPGTPLEGQLYYNTGDDNLYVYTSAGWVDLTSQGSGSTNLGTTYAATSVTITSSTGTDATINLANGTTAGVSENNLTDAMVTTIGNTSGTNTGDQSATLVAGVGLSGTTYDPDTSTTFNLDFSELTDMTAGISGTTEFILQNGTTESRKAASEITLSTFNNDAGWTDNTGTVTSIDVDGGTGITVTEAGPITTSGTFTVNIDYLGTDNFIDSATNLEGTIIAVGDTIVYHDATDNNVKKGLVSDLPFNDYSHPNHTGEVTSVADGATTVTVSAITNKTALTTGLEGTDELLINDGGVIKRMDVSVMNAYFNSNLSFNDYSHPNHTGDVTSVGDGATTITNNAVTNAKLADMAAHTVKVRNAGTSGDPSDFVLGTNEVLGRLSGNIQGIDIIDDDTMATATASNLSTSEAIKAYVDSSVSGQLVYQGGYNASTNTPDLDTTPSASILTGWTYTVTAAGTFFTEDVQIGDLLISEVDSPTTLADWTIVNKNIPDIVSASETEEGIIEIATQAETDAGTDDARAITPLKLENWPGSTNIDTVGTITTGTWQGSVISTTYIQNTSGTNTGDEVQATESVAGIAEIATQGETNTGTDDQRIVTPLKLATYISNENIPAKFSVDLDSLEGSVARANLAGVTTFTVTHNLGSLDVVVSVRDIATGEMAGALVDVVTTNTIDVKFNDSGNTNDDDYRVVIVG